MVTTELLPCTDWSLDVVGETGQVPPSVLSALPIASQAPSTVHLDLLAAALIPDPYLDQNEIGLDWIGRTAWVLTHSFEAPQHWFDERGLLMPGTGVALELDGVDTVATIALNGTELARTANMHRRYRFPIDGAIAPGTNTITVRLDSAWEYAEAYQERSGGLPNAYPTPFNFIRKNASNFGWDWGPTLVTAGLWRPVRVVRTTQARIASLRPQVDVTGADGHVTVDVDVERHASDADLAIEVEIDGVVGTTPVPADGSCRVGLVVPRPRLWWPRGLGAQPLYDLHVRLTSGSGTLEARTHRVGFRSVRLRTDADDDGSQFTFEINGALVPIRGANWIPDDCFLPRVDDKRIAARLDQAEGANLNLLRVWGGGVYESEELYRACDERGILVWQDFLFACAAYPEDEPLRGEVEAEARDNVERLMPHPSLVLWNGNNENIWGWHDWQWQPVLDGRPWGAGYYFDLLPSIVREVDPTRTYWPGSPYSGSGDIHPNDPAHGCSHEWTVWNGVGWEHYVDTAPRFVAEFGWRGPPAWSTLERAVSERPLSPYGPGVLHHQKAEDGNGKLERGLAPQLEVPTEPEDWHFAMQVNQAHAIGFALAYYRSLRPLNMGAIVWQLNDCWPVTSWAAVDGDGRKKPLWYAMRAGFATRLLTVQPEAGGLAVVAVNDSGDS